MYTEEKAKVVAAVWGTELIKFLAAPAILWHQDDLKIRMNSSFSSYYPGANHIILFYTNYSSTLYSMCVGLKIPR